MRPMTPTHSMPMSVEEVQNAVDRRHREGEDPDEDADALHGPHGSASLSFSSTNALPPRSAGPSASTRPLPSATLGVHRGRPAAVCRVVQVERGALGADPRDAVEVVPRRRAGGRPLQRRAVAPRVVGLDEGCGAPRLPHVVRGTAASTTAQDDRADGRDPVAEGEAVLGHVVGVAPRHALDAEQVLHEEGRVEPDEEQPEVDLAEPLVEHPAGELGPPEVEARRTSRRPRCRRRRSGSAPRRSSCRTAGSPGPGWRG